MDEVAEVMHVPLCGIGALLRHAVAALKSQLRVLPSELRDGRFIIPPEHGAAEADGPAPSFLLQEAGSLAAVAALPRSHKSSGPVSNNLRVASA
ncbi:MAG: hypothetical protein ACE5IJ_06295 [Thermoplasmata archaeon]